MTKSAWRLQNAAHPRVVAKLIGRGICDSTAPPLHRRSSSEASEPEEKCQGAGGGGMIHAPFSAGRRITVYGDYDAAASPQGDRCSASSSSARRMTVHPSRSMKATASTRSTANGSPPGAAT